MLCPLTIGETVHPRACGERPRISTRSGISRGSSPRMRGTLPSSTLPAVRGRFIPAHAGNARGDWAASSAFLVHPRACGERQAAGFGSFQPFGSSPRMRGTPEAPTGVFSSGRFIPAHAGNALAQQPAPSATSVHPRACGERVPRFFCSARPRGSSPRMRGTQLLREPQPTSKRFIPAHAGNAYSVRLPEWLITVHPRACGERAPKLDIKGAKYGSSPRMRGTRFQALVDRGQSRFIPAHAGNACILDFSDSK